MSLKSTILALAASIAVADAHMMIEKPVPFSKDKLDNGPITKAQFPCKSNLGFTVSQMNQMAVGQKQQVTFKGTAVHGGGSCQLSVTTDPEPSANSVFKVIKSIEGGCPGTDGQGVPIDFTLPDSIPNGKATFAWTWFAKLSGAPEMYMNCAPIEVTGGASDKTAFNALPDMFVANLGGDCKSKESMSVKFPTPGKDLTVLKNDAVPPVGSCATSSGGGDSPAQPPAGQQPSSGPKSSAAAQPSAPAVGQPSPPAGGKPSAAPKPSASAAPPSNPGGVFAPGASSAAGAPAQSTSTTLVTVTAAPTPAKPTAPAAPAPGTGTPAKPSTPASGGGSTGTCSTNGAIVCNGEKQFGLCNNGNIVWQDVAAGTACVNGVISKRSYNGRIVRRSL